MIKKVLYIMISGIIGIFLVNSISMSNMVEAFQTKIKDEVTANEPKYTMLLSAFLTEGDNEYYYLETPVYTYQTEDYTLNVFATTKANNGYVFALTNMNNEKINFEAKETDKGIEDLSKIVVKFGNETYEESLYLTQTDKAYSLPILVSKDTVKDYSSDTITEFALYDAKGELIFDSKSDTKFTGLSINNLTNLNIKDNGVKAMNTEEIVKYCEDVLSNTGIYLTLTVYLILTIGGYFVFFKKKKNPYKKF